MSWDDENSVWVEEVKMLDKLLVPRKENKKEKLPFDYTGVSRYDHHQFGSGSTRCDQASC